MLCSGKEGLAPDVRPEPAAKDERHSGMHY